jgi:hypothetical protein
MFFGKPVDNLSSHSAGDQTQSLVHARHTHYDSVTAPAHLYST